MFFLPEYGILCTAVQNLPRTIPAEGKVHSPQGRTRCPPQKQGIRRTGSFPFCLGGRSTGASPRRNVSLFSQNTYHLRTAYQGPAQPVWKAVPGKYPGEAVPQKGSVKKTAAWGGHTSPRKNGVQPVRWIYVPTGLTAPL